MPRYVVFNQGLIEDGDFLSMSHEAQRAFYFLRLDPRLGISGLGRFAWQRLTQVIDLRTEKATIRVFEELGTKWIRYDRERELLWIVNAYLHEPSKNPNVRKAVAREVCRAPASGLLHGWWNLYESLFPPMDVATREIIDFLRGVPKPYRNPIEGAPEGFFARAPVPDPDPVRSGSGVGNGGDSPKSVGGGSQELDPTKIGFLPPRDGTRRGRPDAEAALSAIAKMKAGLRE